MKIASVSDPHVGNFPKFGGPHVSGINVRCSAALLSLSRAVQAANKAACAMFVINGDLFDIDTPTPQVEAAVIGSLRNFHGDVHIVAGNHDMHSASEGDNALGPLAGHATAKGEIFVHEVPSLLGSVLFAPYNSSPVGEWLPQALDRYRPETVFGHFGIIDSSTPEFMQRSAADAHEWKDLALMMSKAGTTLLCVGNWHNPGSWASKHQRIEQVGALTPTGFDNLGPNFGRVLMIDTSRPLSMRVGAVSVAGPRFVKLVWGADLLHCLEGHGDHVYAYMEAEPEELVVARAWLRDEGARAGIKDFVLMPSKVTAVKKAKAAAQATSLASNMQEAVDTYITKMPIPDGVDRSAVSTRVQGYLKAVGGIS